MQHQYWSLRRSVLRTLGGKEDECIVASDAELDAKLELFRSISESCATLQRVLDQYQERLCILAQEESSLGRFLRETGRGGEAGGGGERTRGEDAAARHMISAGKAISYCGQQRLNMRSPLLRLHHEIETFRCRAVSDTLATVSDMEKARGEYRAALGWMKAASEQLDPDTGRGLDKFRRAQQHTKHAKLVFDKLTLDVLQKIDLLAAARCNMFSHVLANYQSSFLTFASKVHQTLHATSDSMLAAPKYDFCILKELTQGGDGTREAQTELDSQDKDQMLFFQDEYKDETDGSKQPPATSNKTEPAPADEMTSVDLLASTDLVDTSCDTPPSDLNSDLAGISMNCDIFGNFGGFMPSQLQQDANPSCLQELLPTSKVTPGRPANTAAASKAESRKPDMSAWFKIFAELDPLANPDALPGSNAHQSHAA